MRHKKNFNHLGRKRGHRKAMLSNMASSLIIHKRIKTTTAKAKALKTVIEPLITKAKNDTTHARREAFRILQDKEATNELFREVSVKVGDRPGGYTRIIKLGARLGDNAEMCIIELVDYNENMLAEKAAATKSSRRRRGGKKKDVAETTDAVVESPSDEAADDKEEKAEEVVAEDVSSETSVQEEVVAEDVSSETSVQEEAVAEDVSSETSVQEEAMDDKSPSAEAADDKPSSAEAADDKKAE